MALRTVAETDSTNDDMAALAEAGAAEGLWLRAERQRAGRGRQGRSWISPPGNLYASTLVRLGAGDPPPASLAFVTGVALHEALSAFAPGLALKWPNDILGGAAKLAGILLERRGAAVIIGCGANLAHHPDLPERPTTAIAALAGHAPDPDAVLHALAESFARWLGRWRGEGVAPVLARWQALAHAPGTALAAHLPDGTRIAGLYEGLEPDGALRLRLADGTRHVIHAADIFLVQD
ncbi:biotin--[acetyl-CoA-carboxylase] ligase [Sphingomonas morindae]|uniref:biotin--[biotin carboxyl-carrier protein] ligase n=1 Tax=Sphingomonas morindae TaxID=1541170 RepID=A0ABY4XC55_9SPHN|nr:biotin--[acetyl-CoA-carboxylase] ligase [Sphingomonas morindae]USI74548.1 biotin--[acetyl-CoA-carboxylase] ligase [Sphingomonas morindae]